MIIDYRCSEKGLHLPDEKTLPRWNAKVISERGLPATDLRDEREDAAAHCLAASGQVFCVQMALFELRQRGWWHTASWSVSCLSHLPTEHFLLPNQTNFAPSNLSNITGTLQLFLPALHPRCSCELRHGDRPRFQVLQPHLQHLLHSGCIFHYI